MISSTFIYLIVFLHLLPCLTSIDSDCCLCSSRPSHQRNISFGFSLGLISYCCSLILVRVRCCCYCCCVFDRRYVQTLIKEFAELTRDCGDFLGGALVAAASTACIHPLPGPTPQLSMLPNFKNKCQSYDVYLLTVHACTHFVRIQKKCFQNGWCITKKRDTSGSRHYRSIKKNTPNIYFVYTRYV